MVLVNTCKKGLYSCKKRNRKGIKNQSKSYGFSIIFDAKMCTCISYFECFFNRAAFSIPRPHTDKGARFLHILMSPFPRHVYRTLQDVEPSAILPAPSWGAGFSNIKGVKIIDHFPAEGVRPRSGPIQNRYSSR